MDNQGNTSPSLSCKGCGLCAEECPCGAIDMVKERK
ncbi:MAG: 4Fe-4S binding protein [Nitrospinae bacterium]|nr:4Fe-4S binding protein [Nitrospinota bacterium]